MYKFQKTVNIQRDIIYDIFTNYNNYQDIIPQHFPSIRVKSKRGNISIAEEHLNLGQYKLLTMSKHVIISPTIHEIFVIGGDIKGSYIKQEFLTITCGTRIIITINLKLKGRMRLIWFKKRLLEQEYTKIINDLIIIAQNLV